MKASHSVGSCAAGILLSLVSLFATLASSANAQSHPDIPFGGHHEVGITAGYSPFTGPLFGESHDVLYSATVLRYSFLIRDGRHVQLRYAPEATALATLRETMPTEVNPYAPATHFGGGLSPASFQLVFTPHNRVQPFLSEAAGIIYYNGRVLSPQGSQLMFTIDFGAGANVFVSPRNAITAGYRYVHSSNGNINIHNPGTDADLFYAGFSHFFTKHQK